MELSSLTKDLRNRTGILLKEQMKENFTKDFFSTTIRRGFVLSQFNVIRLETLSLFPLRDLNSKVPRYSFPFCNIAANHLNGMIMQ